MLFLLALFSTKEANASYPLLSKAQSVVRNIDYLPFTSKRDGCYARAYYMGIELAIHGIPSTNQYVFGKLRPTRNITWKYHVAPIVALSPKKFAIIDPSLASTPMTRKHWLRLNNPSGAAKLYVTPAHYYKKKGVQNTNYQLKKRAKKVRQMKDYSIENIADACMTAWHHIGKEKSLSYREKRAKRNRLQKRTHYLIKRLKDLDLLNKSNTLLKCDNGAYRL